MNNIELNNLYSKIKTLIYQARNTVVRNINTAMVTTYYHVGRLILENEQKGKERAAYAESIIENLSKVLTREFGKGFSETNLKQMRSFYKVYMNRQTVSDEFRLSWSHYECKYVFR